jgi:thioredoxin 1
MAYEFNDGNFKSEVLDSQKVIMVDLWAEWCGPCKAMGPIVDDLATVFEGKAVIGKLNVDDNPEVPTTYNVRGIPTFLIFKGGELVDKVVGTATKQALKDKIDALLV